MVHLPLFSSWDRVSSSTAATLQDFWLAFEAARALGKRNRPGTTLGVRSTFQVWLTSCVSSIYLIFTALSCLTMGGTPKLSRSSSSSSSPPSPSSPSPSPSFWSGEQWVGPLLDETLWIANQDMSSFYDRQLAFGLLLVGCFEKWTFMLPDKWSVFRSNTLEYHGCWWRETRISLAPQNPSALRNGCAQTGNWPLGGTAWRLEEIPTETKIIKKSTWTSKHWFMVTQRSFTIYNPY